MPSPALNVKYRSPASPSPMVRYRPASTASLILAIAAAVSTGSPSARAKTLAPPPGMTASSGACCGRRLRRPAHDPVDSLVDGPVAAEHDDELAARRRGQLTSVAAVPGMFYV